MSCTYTNEELRAILRESESGREREMAHEILDARGVEE